MACCVLPSSIHGWLPCRKDRDWLRSAAQSDVKACVFCTKMVPINAIKCPHCNEVIDAKRYSAAKQELKEASEAIVPKNEVCNDCGKSFRTQKELVKHRIDRTDCNAAVQSPAA